MATQFYVTLPSNSKSSNTAAVFHTDLPVNINLEGGEWEVGLSEIIYANTWHNLSLDQNTIKFIDVKSGIQQKLTIPPARYKTVEELIRNIRKAIAKLTKMTKIPYNTFLDINYDLFKKSVQLIINQKYINNVEMSRHLMYMLGYDEKVSLDFIIDGEKSIITANHPPDMFGGLHCFYIYCDILQPQIVGNSLAPLLQVVNIEGEYREIISRTYISPHYIPVLKKSFNTIEINIKDDLDEPVPFQFGKTIVKLHFKQKI